MRERVDLVGGEPEEADGLFVVFYEAAKTVREEEAELILCPRQASSGGEPKESRGFHSVFDEGVSSIGYIPCLS